MIGYKTNPEILEDIDKPKSSTLVVYDSLWKAKVSIDFDKKTLLSFGGTFRASELLWIFPSGATVRYGYVDDYDDTHKLLGYRFSKIIFDEDSKFTYKSVVAIHRREFPILLRCRYE